MTMNVRRYSIQRLKNRLLARLTTRFPSLAKRFVDAYKPQERTDTPWSPVRKSLSAGTVALVTTAGVHHKNQTPFDMNDPEGDPSFRVIDAGRPIDDLMITHDYYDHTDADKDINIVFPIQRLRELERRGVIGKTAATHYGFMGHIDGRHIPTLVNRHAPKIAEMLRTAGVDIVLLTPG